MKKNIVVIEDDVDIAQSIRYNLEREGNFQVRLATSGETGLRTVLEHPPNLIVLDINLPLMNGFEICRRLRRDEETSQICGSRVHEADAEASRQSRGHRDRWPQILSRCDA